MDNVVREAKDKGYVETLFHRRRELPDINSRNFTSATSQSVQLSTLLSKEVLLISSRLL